MASWATATCCVASGLAVAPAFGAADRPPDIVLMLADALGYRDVGCYGARPDAIATPEIDRPAAAGLRFTDAYAPASTCTPTRYSIFAGGAPLIITAGRRTLPALVREAGYRTGPCG